MVVIALCVFFPEEKQERAGAGVCIKNSLRLLGVSAAQKAAMGLSSGYMQVSAVPGRTRFWHGLVGVQADRSAVPRYTEVSAAMFPERLRAIFHWGQG